MDFEKSDDQRAITEAVEALLDRRAGPQRAIELGPEGAYDAELERDLREAGFAGIALAEETGALEAALVVECVAKACGVVSAGAGILVAPLVVGEAVAGPVALASAGRAEPVRFGAHARTALVVDGDVARRVRLEPGSVAPVASNFGYPMGRVRVESGAGESLGAGSGASLRNWWRLALAAEAVGTMGAALEVTLDYVKRRRQFGRAIGSFQAVQHRLAECSVLVEGSRWLTYEAAFHGATVAGAATAAAHAMHAAHRIFNETHQFTGAMGFTREHDLHAFSMRLWALRLELDGAVGHRRAAARARWAPAP